MFTVFVEKSRYDASFYVSVKEISKVGFKAKSNKSNDIYIVRYLRNENRMICDCADFKYRQKNCKHIIAVLMEYSKNTKFEIIEDIKNE
jgi:hypothetical protein